MSSSFKAVIDLGTNTFHILVGALESGKVIIKHKERAYVYLGKGGVDKINPKNYQLGIDVLSHFKSILSKEEVVEVRVLGTSALRSASNGPQFVREVKEKLNFDVEVIDGEEEAQLIFEGIQLAKAQDDHSHLIMDIGGGSVEFILFKRDNIIWKRSYKVGISVLHPQFQKSDPIGEVAIAELFNYLESELEELIEVIDQYQIKHLIGASGSFDVLSKLLNLKSDKLCAQIELDQFDQWTQRLLTADIEERLSTPNLDPQRAELIQIALLLIQFVLEKSRCKSILVSPFAMKEGAMKAMFS